MGMINKAMTNSGLIAVGIFILASLAYVYCITLRITIGSDDRVHKYMAQGHYIVRAKAITAVTIVRGISLSVARGNGNC